MALVYSLYQVMGQSFVKVDIFPQRRKDARDAKDDGEDGWMDGWMMDSSEDLHKKKALQRMIIERYKDD